MIPKQSLETPAAQGGWWQCDTGARRLTFITPRFVPYYQLALWERGGQGKWPSSQGLSLSYDTWSSVTLPIHTHYYPDDN